LPIIPRLSGAAEKTAQTARLSSELLVACAVHTAATNASPLDPAESPI